MAVLAIEAKGVFLPQFYMHLSQWRSAGNVENEIYQDAKSPVSRCTLPARLELHNNKGRNGWKAKSPFCPVHIEFPQPPISNDFKGLLEVQLTFQIFFDP